VDEATPTRGVVGEDHPIFREGLVRVLEGDGFEVVAAAENAEDVVRKTRAHRPDVVVVDIQMPPDLTDDGLRAALEIRASEPEAGVLVLSEFLEDRYAVDLVGDRAEGVATCSRTKSAMWRYSPTLCVASRPKGPLSIRMWSHSSSAVSAGTVPSTG
jgi:DNA-binding NarL/FixJ family response regulator